MTKPLLQLSHLSEEQYIQHLNSKPEPTEEDIESALRIESLLNAYRDVLERVHTLASSGGDAQEALSRIRKFAQPVNGIRVARLN